MVTREAPGDTCKGSHLQYTGGTTRTGQAGGLTSSEHGQRNKVRTRPRTGNRIQDKEPGITTGTRPRIRNHGPGNRYGPEQTNELKMQMQVTVCISCHGSVSKQRDASDAPLHALRHGTTQKNTHHETKSQDHATSRQNSRYKGKHGG
jgi:hypothetical protein